MEHTEVGIQFDRVQYPVGTVPNMIEFVTELAKEAQRGDLLQSVLEGLANQQGLLLEDERAKKDPWRTDPWATTAGILLPTGQRIVGEIVEQQEWVVPEKSDPYWSDWHQPSDFNTDHQKIRYRVRVALT